MSDEPGDLGQVLYNLSEPYFTERGNGNNNVYVIGLL